MPDSTLSLRALNRALLARQLLLSRQKTTVVDVVERLVGLQAQLARPPFVGLWTRLAQFERDDLLGPLRTRTIVRGTAMRGTLHLLAARDYVQLRGALQPGLERGALSIIASRKAVVDQQAVLTDGRTLFKKPSDFDTVRAALAAKYRGVDERAMGYLVRCFLPLVQVPTEATWGFPPASEFVMADQWLGKKISTEHAAADEIVLRYLAAFGPATPADAQNWSGLQGLRPVFEKLRPRLVSFRDERKRELFDLPDAPRPSEETPAPPRFLPEFDNLVLAHEDRTRVISDAHRPLIVSKNLQVSAALLIDGMVAGKWTVSRKRSTATMTVTLFGRVTKKGMAPIEQEGDAVLQFLEPDATTREVKAAS